MVYPNLLTASFLLAALLQVIDWYVRSASKRASLCGQPFGCSPEILLTTWAFPGVKVNW